MKNYNVDINDLIECFNEYGIKVRKGTGRVTLDGNDVRLSALFESFLAEAKEKMTVTTLLCTGAEYEINGISTHDATECPVMLVTAA